jgi:eukaryotic-like serine/threonine-protein kinase
MSGLTKLGKYQIRRELGKGAMGIVYEGFDPVIERTVAIKTIRPEQLDASQADDVLARFKREAQAAGRLNHPNIVGIYDYSEADVEVEGGRIAFIAMEFVKGKELKDYFDANQRFAAKDIERIMGALLDALGHAHAAGVVHRDIKPANVILLADGKVKVADFGIARIENSELTQAGTVMGTPSYMSPEQFLGQPVDGRTDLYSCGVILYQFLTGEKPFMGTTTTIMHKVLKEEPLPPSTLNVTLQPAWDAVVKKAMAKIPSERYRTAAEFAAAIKAVVSGQGVDQTVVDFTLGGAAPEATVVDRTVPAASPAASARATAAPAAAVPQAVSGGARTNPWLLLGGAAVLLVAIGAGTYVALGKRGAPEPVVAQGVPASAPQPSGAVVPVVAKPATAAPEPAPEPGTMIISALGLADPKDPKFNGDQAAAQAEARTDAKRQLVEKALSLYVDKGSLSKNYAVIEQKLLPRSGTFIKTVIQEGAPETGKGGLVAAETRAVVRVRDVQKSLNQMSKDERIDFIRNNGDPKISILMSIRNADTAQALAPERSQLAENLVKERIKSFGFRVWAAEGETKTGPDAKSADFQIQGEVRVKQLSARLEASGITITKTVLTSWTVKAIDKASGEEIYLNTVTPKGKSWSTEEQALADIGKLVGDEFSKNFFLQHFNFSSQRVNLKITGLPDAGSARLLLRELRGIRQVLDAQLTSDSGGFQLQLPEGSAPDIIQEAVLKPLNAKLGQNCFALAGSSGADVNVAFSGACAEAAVRARLETAPPAGLFDAADPRSKALFKAAGGKTLL